ncbi:hypothetical protein RhiirA5_361553 [Rhizophagus irregularis]|uniref:Uncharacterized protein n=1 Tax=Rhizophagus irregularis TaxID=588596 RepID=A0A2N0PEJ5_9GLOM|nr:hypothetical protein RhiirA5_361553 [Rhizophagus irregularis]
MKSNAHVNDDPIFLQEALKKFHYLDTQGMFYKHHFHTFHYWVKAAKSYLKMVNLKINHSLFQNSNEYSCLKLIKEAKEENFERNYKHYY